MMLHRVVLDLLVICFSCTASERLYILLFEVGRSGALFQRLLDYMLNLPMAVSNPDLGFTGYRHVAASGLPGAFSAARGGKRAAGCFLGSTRRQVGCRALSRQHAVASGLPGAFGLLRAAALVQVIGSGAIHRPWCEKRRRGMRRDKWGVQVVEAHAEG
jgi:hypothetical protein